MECNVPTDIVFSFTGFALRGGKTGPARRRLGAGALRRQVRAQLPRADAGLHQPDGRVHPPEPDQDAARGRARAQEDPGPRLAGEHPPVQARAVGAPLGVRPQRHAAADQGSGGCATRRRSARPTASTPSAGCSSSCAPPSRAATRSSRAGCGGRSPSSAGTLGAEGKFNFLLADGRHLYARCGTKLCYIVRQAPFGRATLRDAEMAIDFSAVTTAQATASRWSRPSRSRATSSGSTGTPGTLVGLQPGRAARDPAEPRRPPRSRGAAAGGPNAARPESAPGARPSRPGGRRTRERARLRRPVLGCQRP